MKRSARYMYIVSICMPKYPYMQIHIWG